MTVELQNFKSWEPYQEVEKIIARDGLARIYLVATSCGMKSPSRTATKLREYATRNRGIRYTDLESYESGRNGKEKIIKTPALTCLINSPDAFVHLWNDAARIRASCGCSVFISDGQAVDIRVIGKDYALASDRSARLCTGEIYKGPEEGVI